MTNDDRAVLRLFAKAAVRRRIWEALLMGAVMGLWVGYHVPAILATATAKPSFDFASWDKGWHKGFNSGWDSGWDYGWKSGWRGCTEPDSREVQIASTTPDDK